MERLGIGNDGRLPFRAGTGGFGSVYNGSLRFGQTGRSRSPGSDYYSGRVDAVLTEAYTISTIPTQRTIIQALSHFEFPSSYALFLQALQSPDHLTRQSAIAGLGELDDPRGLPILRNSLLQDTNVGVRSEAAFRLGKLGSSADVRALRQAMETDPTPTVHFWASWALVQIGQDT